MKSYKVTNAILAKYHDEIKKGSSKAAACRAVGIAPTTMSDHLKRLADEVKYPYSVMKRSGVMSVIVNDNIYNINTESAVYVLNKELILSLLNRDDYSMTQSEYNQLIGDADYKPEIKDLVATTEGNLSLKNGKCLYKKKEVSKSLYGILTLANKKKDANIIKFADLLLQNTDDRIITQLFDFIQHNDIGIDKDGYVICFKAVTHNYLDHRTGKFDNSVGKTVTEDRAIVDTDPNRTCSRGLHVGSMSYINKYYGGANNRVIKCKVHPKDFVSIPVDYSGAKARVCEYKVLADVTATV